MENVYKKALEIILNLCIHENYGSKDEIQIVCETVLKESEDNDV